MNPHPPPPHHSPYPLPPASQQPPHHDYAQTAAAALSSAGPPQHAPLGPQQHGQQQQHHPPPPPPTASQHHIPTPNNTAAPNGRKRKAGQPGSRGVANLTPEQLAKKRANDREAQRNIRERTKNTIESLEARIRELESQQPYQELQKALADRDRALQECEELRTRLSAVAGIVGNRELGQTGLNELAALTAQQSPLPSTAHSTPSQYPNHHPPQNQQHYEHAPPQQHLHPDLRSPNNSSATGSPAGAPPAYQASEGVARKWSPSLEHQAQQHYPPHSVPYEQPRPAPPAQMQQPGESNGERLGVNFLLDQQHSSPLTGVRSLPSSDDAALRIVTRHIMTCPLDNLLGDFVKTRRQQAASGKPYSQVIGSDKPSLVSLLYPEVHNKRPSADYLTPVIIDILSKFPGIDRLPERIGVLYGMYFFARWLICPCQSCLDRCPPWARPIPEALEHDHAVWIDYLPHPSMRRKLILARTPGTRVNFDDWFVSFTYTLSVNWPYPASSCTIITPAANPEDPPTVDLNPTFEEHICRLENWSVGPEFANNFPELLDETVRVTDSRKRSR